MYWCEILLGTVSTMVLFMFFYATADPLWFFVGVINALAVIYYGIRPWKSVFDKEPSKEPSEVL